MCKLFEITPEEFAVRYYNALDDLFSWERENEEGNDAQ